VPGGLYTPGTASGLGTHTSPLQAVRVPEEHAQGGAEIGDELALSGHDSTPWTYEAFGRAFGDRYRTLRAGEELQITAAAA